MKRSWESSSSSSLTVNPNRVVLLLDLDCFYAQCEIIRLGIDQTLPLTLMQWDAALAVNYPAREFGIKRGDSFQIIQEKSKGQCIALHLPVKFYDMAESKQKSQEISSIAHNIRDEGVENHTTSEEMADAVSAIPVILNGTNSVIPDEEEKWRCIPTEYDNTFLQTDVSDIMDTLDGEASIDDSYKIEYCLSRQVQLELFEKEKNTMKEMNHLRNQGKASLDRYVVYMCLPDGFISSFLSCHDSHEWLMKISYLDID